MEDPDQIHQHTPQEIPGRPNDSDHPHGKRPSGDLSPQDRPGSLSEHPAEELSGTDSHADGRIIEAGEGGTAGGLDEAEEALVSPVGRDADQDGKAG